VRAFHCGDPQGVSKAEITFITSDVAYEILRYHPGIDRFIIWGKKTSAISLPGILMAVEKTFFTNILIDLFTRTPAAINSPC
jgi:hypothetical protein